MLQIPSSLQGVLWSTDVSRLDREKNKSYIIHQILAFGTLEDIQWLFTTYNIQTIRDVFMNQPIKVYTRQAFHFAKLILDVTNDMAPAYRYDRTLPRHIG